MILLISCKAKQTVIYDVNPSIRPQLKKRIPTKKDLPIVETFFSDWANKSSAIPDTEYNNLDSITKLAYEVFESLYIDTCFIGLKLDKLNAKYILIPNQIRIGIADSVRKHLGFIFYDNLNQLVLDDFRPKISISNKQTLY